MILSGENYTDPQTFQNLLMLEGMKIIAGEKSLVTP